MSKRKIKSEASVPREARKLGYALMRPCGDAAIDIAKHSAGPCILVPHNSGLFIEDMQTILEREAAHVAASGKVN